MIILLIIGIAMAAFLAGVLFGVRVVRVEGVARLEDTLGAEDAAQWEMASLDRCVKAVRGHRINPKPMYFVSVYSDSGRFDAQSLSFNPADIDRVRELAVEKYGVRNIKSGKYVGNEEILDA